jgi:hypothetical protein
LLMLMLLRQSLLLLLKLISWRWNCQRTRSTSATGFDARLPGTAIAAFLAGRFILTPARFLEKTIEIISRQLSDKITMCICPRP